MANRQKVKRYKNIYSDSARKRKQRLKWTAALLGCALFVYVGYILFGVIQEYMDGGLAYVPPEDETPSSSEIMEGSRPIDPDDTDIEVVPPTTEEVAEMSRNVVLEGMNGVYMPIATLKSDTAFNTFVANAKAKGYDAVVFDLKDSSGNINYQTESEAVLSGGAVAEDAVDMAGRLEALEEAGLTPVARVYAFQDDVASRVIPNSYVMYGQSETRWLDNSADQGGRSWLNPESETAQAYVTNVAEDIASLGIEFILLDAVQYPSGLSLGQAYFGPKSAASRINVLSEFVSQIEEIFSTNNCTIIMMNTTVAHLSGDDMLYGGKPSEMGASAMAVSIFPSAFTPPFEVGDESIAAPAATPYETTKAVIDELLALVDDDVILLPFVQYYGGYETAGADEQIRALEESGVMCRILYNDSGVY